MNIVKHLQYLVLVQPENTGEMELWELVLELVTRPPPRALLPSVTTLDDAVQLIKNSKNILILSGAGVRTNQSFFIIKKSDHSRFLCLAVFLIFALLMVCMHVWLKNSQSYPIHRRCLTSISSKTILDRFSDLLK